MSTNINTRTEAYISNETPFIATRTMFRNAVGCEKLSYEAWLALPETFKAAGLYITFFDQITLAWSKAKSFYVVDEDGVSTLLQYLVKNIPLIVADKKKYSPSYIYKVAYNCMYCVSRDIKRDKDAYENNTPQYVQCGDSVLDLFDTVPDVDDIETIRAKKRFWSIIDSVDDDTFAVIENLMDHSRMPAGLGKKKEHILSDLRNKLEAVKCLYDAATDNNSESKITFSDVLAIDDEVASAVVVLPNDAEAVYYGETVQDDCGYIIGIVLFGSDKDYTLPIDAVINLKVTDIERY